MKTVILYHANCLDGFGAAGFTINKQHNQLPGDQR